MVEAFASYYKALDLPSTVIERIDSILAFYTPLCPEDITGIFLTDRVREDGSVQYVNLWFFSESYVMEAKEFLTKDDFDNMSIRKRIVRWAVEKTEYDFRTATEKSRLTLYFFISDVIGGEFTASKSNCDYLRDVFVKYIVPNMMS